MKRIWLVRILLGAMVVGGCAPVPLDPPPTQTVPSAPPSPIPQGVYRGQVDCEVTTITPEGSSVDPVSSNVTLEINERGVPVILGAEIAVGRTVHIGEFEATYLRVEATPAGMVLHGQFSAGASIAELAATDDGLDYWIDVVAHQNNTTLFRSCYGFLE